MLRMVFPTSDRETGSWIDSPINNLGPILYSVKWAINVRFGDCTSTVNTTKCAMTVRSPDCSHTFITFNIHFVCLILLHNSDILLIFLIRIVVLLKLTLPIITLWIFLLINLLVVSSRWWYLYFSTIWILSVNIFLICTLDILDTVRSVCYTWSSAWSTDFLNCLVGLFFPPFWIS